MATNITIDGNLSDWTTSDRLDFLPGMGQAGYEVYGRVEGDNYIFALSSNGSAISAGTTVWLNTDRNSSTGYQVFGSAVGAEYNVNFFTDNAPYLYSGAAGENSLTALNYSYSSDRQVVEFAIPISALGNAPQSMDVAIDVNDQVFLPGDFNGQSYTLFANKNLPVRTDTSKKVGIVFSQTTADQFFGLADVATNQTGYSQLFMSVQEEVMMSGVPFDLLSEDDLKDINNLVNYDTLIFPSFRNVSQADVQQIQDTLTDAIYNYNIGIVTAGDFMTNSETGGSLAGDPYFRMKTLLGLQPQAFGAGNVSLTVNNTTNPIVQDYQTGELIRQYQNPIGYAAYQSYGNANSDVLVNQTVNGQTYNAVVTTQTGGRNVHFATTSYLGDNNLAWSAIQQSVFNNQAAVSLSLTRNESLFLSRNDMDLSAEFNNVNPNDGTLGIYDRLLPILDQWKTDFNFVGSYYINVGDNPATGHYTDWNLSRPYYQALLAAGNEIGTHSYTHLDDATVYNPTNNTNFATPAQIEFEFNQSKLIIEQQLGIKVTGAAVPGAPEKLPTSLEIAQYFDYVSGGATFVGAGYPGAFGFLTPDQQSVYFAPNLWFDFTLIGFGIPVPDGNGGFVAQPLTAQEAEAEWIRQYNEVTSHGNKPIVLMPWHDYGPTNFDNNGYSQQMFTSLIREAYNQGAEFVTLDDASQRIQAFEQAQLFVESAGNTITAQVVGNNLGDFALDLTTGNQTIQSVTNWYAYDNNSVFLPQNGGQFTINLGATQDNVTRITKLPMRAELATLSGNGTNLEYTFFGEGTVVVEIANPGLSNIIGADRLNFNGSTAAMTFAAIDRHNARIFAATTGNDLIEGSVGQDRLVGGQGNDTIYGEKPVAPPTTILVTDFEEAPNSNGFITPLLDGWNSTDTRIEYRTGGSAQGSNHIELNEDPINFYPDARQIYRDINTEAGKFYQLTFQYAPRPGSNANVNAIAVKLAGNNILNVAESGIGDLTLDWKTYTVSFIGNGNSQRLEFVSTGTPVAYGRGGQLDDIKLLAYDNNPNLGGDDTLEGGLGSDRLYGGLGSDRLNGADATGLTPGTAQVDYLNGGAGRDTFVLGDINATYYSYGITTGLLDLAIIQDFNRTEDVIQLKGSSRNYSLRAFGSGTVFGNDTQVGAGVGIMLSDREIIGFVQNANLNDLNLSSSQFVYV